MKTIGMIVLGLIGVLYFGSKFVKIGILSHQSSSLDLAIVAYDQRWQEMNPHLPAAVKQCLRNQAADRETVHSPALVDAFVDVTQHVLQGSVEAASDNYASSIGHHEDQLYRELKQLPRSEADKIARIALNNKSRGLLFIGCVSGFTLDKIGA